MRIDSIMSRQVTACAPSDSLEQAARLMWEHDCGCLPVSTGDGPGGLVGIITDRDICMAALFQGKALCELKVDSAMANPVQTCLPEDDLVVAERKMCKSRVRRLPVVAGDGTLLGIISMADLAREAAREQNLSHQQVSSSEVCSTLAAICAPATTPRAA